jgi:hypothetical protein
MTTALEGGKRSGSRPGRPLPPEKTRYPFYRRLGGHQGRSGQARKISAPTGIRPPNRSARSQSLYRLRQPAHFSSINVRNLYPYRSIYLYITLTYSALVMLPLGISVVTTPAVFKVWLWENHPTPFTF